MSAKNGTIDVADLVHRGLLVAELTHFAHIPPPRRNTAAKIIKLKQIFKDTLSQPISVPETSITNDKIGVA